MAAGQTVIYVAQSLDGYIADREGSVAWLDAYNSKAFDFDGFFDRIDTIVMGRKTYDDVLAMNVPWPYRDRRCVILSHRDLPENGPTVVERYSGDTTSLINELRLTFERIWIVGGAEVFSAFLKAGAVDELNLFILPVLLGGGVTLFQRQDNDHTLELLASTQFDNGVVRLDYAFQGAGAVQ